MAYSAGAGSPGTAADPRFAPFVRVDGYTSPLSLYRKLRLALLSALVLPVKLLLCLCCLVSFYLCCLVAGLLPPAPGTRVVAFLGKLHCRACLFCLGFVYLKWKKVGGGSAHAAGADTQAACIVSNHLSWADILVHMSRSFPSFVARRGTEKLALVGVISQRMQCIYVERESKAGGTQGTAAQVKEHVQQYAADSSGSLRPMCLFAEGTTTNGQYLLPFKTGAFLAGKPVLPVVISYGKGNVSPCWESIGGLEHMHLMLAEPFHAAVCYELPVYHPSEEEARNPRLFADNVRQHMLKYSKLQPSDSTLEDKRHFHALCRASGTKGDGAVPHKTSAT